PARRRGAAALHDGGRAGGRRRGTAPRLWPARAGGAPPGRGVVRLGQGPPRPPATGGCMEVMNNGMTNDGMTMDGTRSSVALRPSSFVMPPPADTPELQAALAGLLGRPVTVTDRRPCPYRSSFGLDELDIELDGGTPLALMFKDLGWHS